jgi:glyoxylase-like metal-dependent hydrolase (beta-lactamase superfamily II)
VQELRPGVWWWEAMHPEWTPEDAATADWGPEVSSYAIDDGDTLLLFDPTAPVGPVADLACARETAIVLTCPWHARETRGIAAELGAEVYAPPPDPDDPDPLRARTFAAGERLTIGVEAFAGMEPNDLVLWVAGAHALVAGDTLIDRGNGLEFPADWANKGVPADEILASLRPLLDLPVQLVLPTHGPPADRAALEWALT